MTIVGTAHFVSYMHAYEYYRPMGYSPEDVSEKISEKEIFIGAPPSDLMGKGGIIRTIDGGKRYGIELH